MARPGLTRHRKFLRLARALGNVPLALGCLELVWEKSYENGNPYLGDAVDVEAAAQWPGEAGALCKALVTAGGDGNQGFIEEVEDHPGHYRVHDLFDHAPRYVSRRLEKEMERKAKGITISEIRAEAGRKGAATTNAKRAASIGKASANEQRFAVTPAPAPKEGGSTPDLPASQLARGILGTVGLPIMSANLRAVTAAIESVAATMNMTIPEAHDWLADKVTQAKKAGQVITGFWFQDARYNAVASALPVERETRAETQARLAREKGLVH